MKRMVIPLLFVGIVVIALGAVAYVVVQTLKPPISYDELTRLQDEGEQAAPEIPRVVACLDVNDEALRAQAAETLSKIGPKSVDAVRAKLASGNPKTRYWAVLTLALLGPQAAAATNDLLPLLKDGDAAVRYKTVYALGKLDVRSGVVLDGLVNALSDSDPSVRGTATEVLDKIDTPSKELVPKLAELAGKEPTRGIALKLLSRIGEPAVPTFKELLKNANALDTIAIIQALPALGKHAKPLLPELQEIMVKSRWWDAEDELLGMFKKCGSDGAEGLTSVLKTLHDPKSVHFAPADDRTKTLLKALGEMGADAKTAVPVLIVLLDESESFRPEILEALGSIGPAASKAIPAVEALTNDAKVADTARVALRRMGKLDVK